MKSVEILWQDHKQNHPDSSTFLVSIEEIMNKLMLGYSLSRYNDTLIIHKPVARHTGTDIEFHCYNAATGEQLALNVLEFFRWAKEQEFVHAWTPYQNATINELFRAHIDSDRLTITNTTTGYEATVRL